MKNYWVLIMAMFQRALKDRGNKCVPALSQNSRWKFNRAEVGPRPSLSLDTTVLASFCLGYVYTIVRFLDFRAWRLQFAVFCVYQTSMAVNFAIQVSLDSSNICARNFMRQNTHKPNIIVTILNRELNLQMEEKIIFERKSVVGECIARWN